jgi:DNA-binding IclR family transcriptional regulator
VLVRGEVVYVDRVDSDASGPFRDSHRVHPALSTAGGRLLAARSDEDGWDLALAMAGDGDRADALSSRQVWAGAEWLAHRPTDRTVPLEVAVPVLDAAGEAVGALASDLTGPEPTTAEGEERAAEVAAYLGRAAKAAGRTLGHG